MLKRIFFYLAIALAWSNIVTAEELGDSVVVVYNSAVPQSKDVAAHYARRRHVPEEQVVGYELPTGETISRAQFRNDLQKPLLKTLEDKQLLVFRLDSSATNDSPHWRVQSAKVRYVILCYGVPLRILEDADIQESPAPQLPPVARRNGAAVDSEITLLPMEDFKLPLMGPMRNPFFGTTLAAGLDPTAGILLAARLDGPTPEIARGLVDKAIEAEANGLWGRAYFDIRGATNEYKQGDDMLRKAAETAQKYGLETIVDTKPETFSVAFPMSQIAFYAGWYDENVSGPFSALNVEFMPGAIAYHLHSFSAATLRTTNKHWAGPLLAKGATATMGCVDEPFVEGMPDPGVFLDRLLHGFTFGESAWASAPVLSWQTTVVGDPLYTPFAKHPRDQHQQLLEKKSPLVEWSHLRVANLNLSQGFPMSEVIDYLEKEGQESAVLMEKLGDLYMASHKTELALQSYKRALVLNPSVQQRIRLRGLLAEAMRSAANDRSK